MSLIVCISGFSGTGKSTAAEYIKNKTGGIVIYLGASVLEEVRSLGMPETRESERFVRLQMRASDPASLAKKQLLRIDAAIQKGDMIVIDAIMTMQEHHFISMRPDTRSYLLEIQAPFDDRCERLANRADRPLSIDEIKERDRIEVENLQIDMVFEAAEHKIYNNKSMKEFEMRLDEFLRSIHCL